VQFFSDRFFGYRSVETSQIQIVQDGQKLPDFEEWEAMATPGHCDDHFSFVSTTCGVLFAGDALDSGGDRLGLKGKRITADMAMAARSARRLLKLTPAVFACGHGRPLVDHEAGDIMMLYQELGALVTETGDSRTTGATGG
jgi:glyoxylase-like metal-dependent hydrolase (beta-lactamase superfamily II)